MSVVDKLTEIDCYAKYMAANYGIPGEIQVYIANESDTMECRTLDKIIQIGVDHILQFSTPESISEIFIDSLPDDPGQLKAFLFRQTPKQLAYLRKLIPIQQSSLEVEAGVLHEIGHIFHQHRSDQSTPVKLRHDSELSADAAACAVHRGRKGTIRWLKREIICLVSSLGRKKYLELSKVVSRSHPSMEKRLSQAHKIDKFFAQISDPFFYEFCSRLMIKYPT